MKTLDLLPYPNAVVAKSTIDVGNGEYQTILIRRLDTEELELFRFVDDTLDDLDLSKGSTLSEAFAKFRAQTSQAIAEWDQEQSR